MSQALTAKVIQPGEIEVGRRGPTAAVVHETASAAAAAKSQAMVQAHFLMALKSPRNWLDVRQTLLKECERTRFAETARYSIPRAGGRVEGWTIRFAEAAMRAMKNLMPETSVAGEDDEKRILKVSVIDLEANLPLSTEIVVQKTIERKSIKDGETPIRTRINSQGATIYILPASEDDLITKQAALVSKALRTMLLRLIPGDLLDECLDEVTATMKAEDEKDPTAAVKKIADGFAGLGVKPSDIKTYLGHEIEASSPAEMQSLRELYSAIRAGDITWREAAAVDGADPKESGVTGQATSLKEKLKAKAAKDAKPAAEGAGAAAAPTEPTGAGSARKPE